MVKIEKRCSGTLKGQSSIEFITVIGIVLVFFILILVVLSQQMLTIDFQGADRYANLLANTVDAEIQLAKTIDGSYARTFELPEEIGGKYFTFELFHGRELRVRDEFGSTTLKFLTGFVCGNVSVGQNEIIKKGSTIGICPGTCNGELPCTSTGEIQCAFDENAWSTCAPSFNDEYAQMRVYCPELSVNGSLKITNVDDAYLMFNESSRVGSDNFATFDVPFVVNESGDYLFEVSCTPTAGATTRYAREYSLPYGSFVVKPLLVSGCGMPTSFGEYNCTADLNFTITNTILCEGGECGDAKIWLDPQ
jgi:hypothetical protein